MSFAIIKTGGKQYKVKTGEIIKIERLEDSKPGTKIEFKFAPLAKSMLHNALDWTFPWLKYGRLSSEMAAPGSRKRKREEDLGAPPPERGTSATLYNTSLVSGGVRLFKETLCTSSHRPRPHPWAR